MAGAEGFEPPYDWTKTSCLTAWLRPKKTNKLSKQTFHTLFFQNHLGLI